MPAWPLIVLAAVARATPALAAVSPTTPPDGDPSCPCVNGTELLSRGVAPACALPPLLDSSAPHGCDGGVCHGPLCYPPSYGTSCATHDAGLAPFCTANESTFCGQSWCWVDWQKCQKSDKSVRLSNFYGSEPAGKLHYSYQTCGSQVGESSWLEKVTAGTEGTHLRVAVPKLFYPVHFKWSAANSSAVKVAADFAPRDVISSYFYDDGAGHYAGAYVDLINAILALPNCNISSVSYHHRSDHSKEETRGSLGSSSHAAAVLDVNKGIADIAIGTTWTTLERLEVSGFAAPLYTDKFYMWSPLPPPSVNWWSFAKPFQADCWAAAGVALLIVGLIHWLLDHDPNTPAPVGARSKPPPKRTKPPSLRESAAESIERVKAPLSSYIYDRLYGASCDLVGGLNYDRFRQPPSRILGLGWGIFCLLFTATYTAELTAGLIESRPAGWWESLEKASASHKRICAQESLEREFRRIGPTVRWAIQDGFIETMTAFAENRCDAMILALSDVNRLAFVDDLICDPEEWWEVGWGEEKFSWAKNATGRGPFPKGPLVRSTNPVVEIPVAIPASPKLAAPLSLWLKQVERSSNRNFLDFVHHYQRASACYPLTGSLGSGSESGTYDPAEIFRGRSDGISFLEMLGSFWLLLAFVVLSLLGTLGKAGGDGVQHLAAAARRLSTADSPEKEAPKPVAAVPQARTQNV